MEQNEWTGQLQEQKQTQNKKQDDNGKHYNLTEVEKEKPEMN